jgi:hypothetical protein
MLCSSMCILSHAKSSAAIELELDKELVMGYVHALGLPCWAGSSMVASLGSICKAGDVDSYCGGNRRISYVQTCWRPQKLRVGRSKVKRRCVHLRPYYESINAPTKASAVMAKLHIFKYYLLLP